ncbi:MAG: hypothetical protein KKA19_03575, partial [Candidatus Margulisbacteria bacterium]|nr:hypothetical protein [Candidatus Margulisiibacteriota bacterium]
GEVTFSVYDANTGGTVLGQQVLTPAGAIQWITWGTATNPLTAAESLQVRRVEIEIQTITTNVQGFIYYRSNIR